MEGGTEGGIMVVIYPEMQLLGGCERPLMVCVEAHTARAWPRKRQHSFTWATTCIADALTLMGMLSTTLCLVTMFCTLSQKGPQ